MSELLDWPSKHAVHVQNVWAAAKAGPLWQKRLPPVLIVGVIGFALSGAASFRIAHYWEAKNHPKHGLLMPADFIPIVGRTDAIVALGQWVLFLIVGLVELR